MERRRKQKSDRASKNSCPLIAVYNRQKALPIQTASVRRLVQFVIDQKKIRCSQIAVHFVDLRHSTLLHGKFFDDPTPTDCMTFPIDKEFLGECVICPLIALERNPKNPHLETSHYLIHSLLHLIGYDDIDKKKQVIMRKEERRLLKIARKMGCLLQG